MTFKEALYWLYYPDDDPVEHDAAISYAMRLIKKYGRLFDAEQAKEDFHFEVRPGTWVK